MPLRPHAPFTLTIASIPREPEAVGRHSAISSQIQFEDFSRGLAGARIRAPFAM